MKEQDLQKIAELMTVVHDSLAGLSGYGVTVQPFTVQRMIDGELWDCISLTLNVPMVKRTEGGRVAAP